MNNNLKFAITKFSGISLLIPMETSSIQSNTVKQPSTRQRPDAKVPHNTVNGNPYEAVILTKQPRAAIAAVRIQLLLPYSFLLLLMYHESDFTSTDAGIKFITKS